LESEDVNSESLVLYVWNWNKVMNHSALGEAHIDLSDITSNPKELKLQLQKTGKGMIHLIIRYGTTLEKPETILSGQLSKQSPITVWQNRYFELKKDGLFWYQSPVANQNLGAIKELSKCYCITDVHKKDLRDIISSEKRFFFGIKTPTKTYFLKAKTEEERNEWIEALQKMGCQLQGINVNRKSQLGDEPETQYQVIPKTRTNSPPTEYQQIPRSNLKKSNSSTAIGTFSKTSEASTSPTSEKLLLSRTLSNLQEEQMSNNSQTNYKSTNYQEIPTVSNSLKKTSSFLVSTYPPQSNNSSASPTDYQQIPAFPSKLPGQKSNPSLKSPTSPQLQGHYQQIPQPPSSK